MAASSQIRFSDDMIGDPNDLDTLIEATGREVSDVSGDEERRNSEEEDGNLASQGESQAESQGSDNDGENKKKDDKSQDPPKKKRKLGPRLTVNPDRLKGPRGLTALLKEFDNFKFKGKGREREDLERVLARMEHWAHRLHPKLHFEDFIARAEKVCTKKKEMQVYMKRLRMGLETPDDDIVRVGADIDDDEDNAPRNEQTVALNEFDKLLGDQIDYYDANPRDHVPMTPATLPPSPAFAPISASTLTAEQKERIAQNKRAAMERRLARMKELEEEQLREATLASLATASEESAVGVAPPAPVEAPANNADVSAEQRERAARNKQLALERLRARRLAALESPQPATDLNTSVSSELAVPLSPSSPRTSPQVSKSPSAEDRQKSSVERAELSPADCHNLSGGRNDVDDSLVSSEIPSQQKNSPVKSVDDVDVNPQNSLSSTPLKSDDRADCVDLVSVPVPEKNNLTDDLVVREKSQSRSRSPSPKNMDEADATVALGTGGSPVELSSTSGIGENDGSSEENKSPAKDALSSPAKMDVSEDEVVPSGIADSSNKESSSVSDKMDELVDTTVPSEKSQSQQSGLPENNDEADDKIASMDDDR